MKVDVECFDYNNLQGFKFIKSVKIVFLFTSTYIMTC